MSSGDEVRTRPGGATAPVPRRAFVATATARITALWSACVPRMSVGSPYASAIPDVETSTLANDVHSQLTPTRVHRIVKPASPDPSQR